MRTVSRMRVLITVTTYPLPSHTYQELVCTAGLTEIGDWVRIYPVPLSALIENRFRKYHWVEIDLEKRVGGRDFRPESYKPHRSDLSDLVVLKKVGTENGWEARRGLCLRREVFSFDQLLHEAFDKQIATSLAVYKPRKLLSFEIEATERDWKDSWRAGASQMALFAEFRRLGIKKVPYKFSYRFEDDTGKIRRLMIEDWEIGQLYWNCLASCQGDESAACDKVRQKYWDDLALTKDLYFFLGTTLRFHAQGAPNPFVIVGLFYPPKPSPQLSLF